MRKSRSQANRLKISELQIPPTCDSDEQVLCLMAKYLTKAQSRKEASRHDPNCEAERSGKRAQLENEA